MNKISGIYKITNTITGDFYIGSSKNVKSRWKDHKCKSMWNRHPNNQLYKDMQKYGVDKFSFEILEEVEVEHLKEKEQQFIETLKPTYNDRNADGLNVERFKEYQKSDKRKETQKKYRQSDKGKETQKKYNNKYQNQLCYFNGETLTLHALYQRFKSQGLSNPTQEAKKYIIKESNNPIEFYDIYP